MGSHMKTTIDIADSLLQRAKKLAVKQSTTLKAVVESALRDKLDRAHEREFEREVRTHVFTGNGLQSGLCWDDWATVRDTSYEGRGG